MFDFYSSKDIACFGVAGNFTGHLEQAGESADFVNVKTKEVNAPKAVFPTYIPEPPSTSPVPSFLSTFPFDSGTIIFPKGEQKLQIEPECAIVFQAEWKETELTSLKPLCFGASNDCSIRKEGAKKISEKKNWGKCSKGYSSVLLEVDEKTEFAPGSEFDRYRIASFLVRKTEDGRNEVHMYGEDSAVRDYSYFYKKLEDWLIEKFNGQKDEGPAEDIHSYLIACGCPKQIMVSVGATRYTDWGEHNFLKCGDISVVVVYPGDKYTLGEITSMVSELPENPEKLTGKDISALIQTVQI